MWPIAAQGLAQQGGAQVVEQDRGFAHGIDAGLGAPSHAAAAMELGASAVLVNTAIAASQDPVAMAGAFAQAVSAGRIAYKAGLATTQLHAAASSPLTDFLAAL